MGRDFYKILGVGRDASESDIKKAFRKQALKYHPDKNKDNPNAEKMFKGVSAAYEVLSAKEKKQLYDQFGEEGMTNMGGGDAAGFQGFPMGAGGFSDPFDIFKQFFGDDVGMGGGMGGGGKTEFVFNMGGSHGGAGGAAGMEDMIGSMFAGMGGGPGMQGVRMQSGGNSPFGFGQSGGSPFSFNGLNGQKGGAKQMDQSTLLKPQSQVQIHGLRAGAQHNGKVATVTSFDSTKHRYTVTLEGTKDKLALKGENIRQIGVQARVGETSNRDLSNTRCEVVGYDAAADRYQVRTSGKTVSMKIGNLVLQPTTLVRLHSLRGGAEHNNKWGTVKSFDRQAGRYEVEVTSTLNLRVKAENLSL